ncbi:MAG: HAD-IA family hydrolase [Verrucomicrobia bacterium]|nr:HAD-IA family hydrolase [Verrucomicrobiota bacterium]
MKRRIEAVTFDVGGTLIEPWPSVGHVYAEVAARFGVRAEPGELARGFGAAWKARRGFDYSRTAWFELVRESFGELARQLPAEFFPAVYQHFAEPEAWRVFEDVRPTLDSLAARGVKLAVISNWDERLDPLLKRLGLHACFEAVVVSCDAGHTKPSPAIFAHALRRLGVPASAALHVGDSTREDAEGARAVGMHAVLVDRAAGGKLTDCLAEFWQTADERRG